METNRLRQFRVVVETGNLRRAAEILAISHSGLSKSMKALEAEVGISLFHASGRGIAISDEGIKLYERSKEFLCELDRFLGKNEVAAERSLRFGSFEVFTSFFLGPLLKDYLPGVPIEVHELGPGRLEEALALNKVDFGISYEPIPRKGVEYVPASSIFVGAYALRGKFTGQSLAEIPFVVPVSPLEGAASGVKHRDAWPDEKVERNIQFRVDSLATGLEITRQGLAAIFMPHFVARLHNRSVKPEFRFEALKLPRGLTTVKREVFIVKRESTVEDRTIRQIARALREICAEE
jgi:DNA-binding transcriptional LysR family regulator